MPEIIIYYSNELKKSADIECNRNRTYVVAEGGSIGKIGDVRFGQFGECIHEGW